MYSFSIGINFGWFTEELIADVGNEKTEDYFMYLDILK